MSELSLTTIVLTYNEEVHISRCLENVCPVSRKVYVVDSPSTDRTAEIASEFENVEVVVHKYPGNQAEQFNWALDNLPIDTEWVLRIDADEYLLPELVDEIKEKLPELAPEVAGIEFKRRHIFMGQWIKRGLYPVKILRLFRNGKGRSEARLMDEHIVVDGDTVCFDNDFCDHNLNDIGWFCQKHINYAEREARQITGDLSGASAANLGEGANDKRRNKQRYNRLPLFWRAFGFFCYRYFIKGGFLEGKRAFIFHFMQCFWYRTLVDAKVYEIKKKSGGDKDKIREILRNEYRIDI